MSKRVLVTGGLGVNGSAIVRELLSRGHELTLFDNRDDRSLIGGRVEVPEVVVGDIRDLSLLQQTMATRRIGVVVHFAGVLAARGVETDPLLTWSINVTGSAAVYEAASQAGVERVVYASSKCIYGEPGGSFGEPYYMPISEDYVPSPLRLYDVTKEAAEQLGRWYMRYKGIEYTALRFSTIIAPGKLERHMGSSVYGRVIELPTRGKPVRVARGGDQKDDFIYVADIASATASAVEVSQLRHPAYNISSGTLHTLFELVDAVKDVLPDADVDVGGGLDPMDIGVRYYCRLDNSRAREDLRWVPRFSLKDAVRDYIKRTESPLTPDGYKDDADRAEPRPFIGAEFSERALKVHQETAELDT